MITIFINRLLKRRFERQIKKYSLPVASKKLLTHTGLSLEINQPDEPKTPTLFISNHHNPLDIFVLAATTPLKTYFVSLKVNKFSRAFTRKILPIYLSYSTYDGKRLRLAGFFWTQLEGRIPIDTVKSLNQKTIAKAAHTLTTGKNVVIFPQGIGFNPDREWKNGVGYLCNQVENSDTQIQFVKVENFKGLDILRIIFPYSLAKILGHKKIKVTFTKPFKLTKKMKQMEPKKLTKYLEKKYQNFYSIK